MILKTTIAMKVISRGLEQISRELEAHLFQYLVSESSSAIESVNIRESVAIAPL